MWCTRRSTGLRWSQPTPKLPDLHVPGGRGSSAQLERVRSGCTRGRGLILCAAFLYLTPSEITLRRSPSTKTPTSLSPDLWPFQSGNRETARTGLRRVARRAPSCTRSSARWSSGCSWTSCRTSTSPSAGTEQGARRRVDENPSVRVCHHRREHPRPAPTQRAESGQARRANPEHVARLVAAQDPNVHQSIGQGIDHSPVSGLFNVGSER